MTDPAAAHAAEFRRCLVELDVAGIRRLWRATAPHLPQPADDGEALETLHRARAASRTLPARLVDYSRDWLAERETRRVAHAVGIAVAAPPHRAERAEAARQAMEGAVIDAMRAGVDLATEPAEIRRRMMRARARA